MTKSSCLKRTYGRSSIDYRVASFLKIGKEKSCFYRLGRIYFKSTTDLFVMHYLYGRLKKFICI